MTVTVLSKPNCVQCAATTRTLDRLGIEYDKWDVESDPEAFTLAVNLGYMAVPVVIVSTPGEPDAHWAGFRPERIEALVA